MVGGDPTLVVVSFDGPVVVVVVVVCQMVAGIVEDALGKPVAWVAMWVVGELA